MSYLVAPLKRDPRFAELFETADSLSTAVVEIAKERVLKPVRAVNTSGCRHPSQGVTRNCQPTGFPPVP